jgi:hypothetical protein
LISIETFRKILHEEGLGAYINDFLETCPNLDKKLRILTDIWLREALRDLKREHPLLFTNSKEFCDKVVAHKNDLPPKRQEK